MLRRIALALLATATAGVAQSAPILIDFGPTSGVTGAGGAQVWNDQHPGNQGEIVSLLDAQGQPAGAMQIINGSFNSANSAGTTTPTPGSAFANLGFPSSVTRDAMWGSSGRTVTIAFTQLDPNRVYDIDFTASRMNVSDVRTTDYDVSGFNFGSARLNASNNQTDIGRIENLLPNANGELSLSVAAAANNTNTGTHYFYLGGMRLISRAVGQTVLAFDRPRLAASGRQNSGTRSLSTLLQTSDGTRPAVTLQAIDTATGTAPTWLTVPPTNVVGTTLPLTFDTSAPEGVYAAELHATASGYVDALLRVQFIVRDPNALNVLFYGNSYSIGNGGVHNLVAALAEESGRPRPFTIGALVGGQSLQFHRTDPNQVAAISRIPLGEQWDFVVMQGFSLGATRLRDPVQFRANAVGIVDNVRRHSPAASAVLYQTWARGPGHGFYGGTFRDPLEMHNEIRTNYMRAQQDIDAAHGADTAHRAAAGEAVWLSGFDPSLYTADLSHPTARTTLMASLAMFQSLYGARACDIQPNWSGGSSLVTWLQSRSVTPAEWNEATDIATRIAELDSRSFGGSDEELRLRLGEAGMLSGCPEQRFVPPATIDLEITSPNGAYANALTILLATPYAPGLPPQPTSIYPELYVGLGAPIVVGQRPKLGQAATFQVSLPPVAPGFNVLFQGIAVGRSTNRNNPLFTATDGRVAEIR